MKIQDQLKTVSELKHFDKVYGKLWETLRIELVASRANFKVKRFISYYPDPIALVVDAFCTILFAK